MAIFTVNTQSDIGVANDGLLTLREAVNLANNSFGQDTIVFDSSVFTGANQSLIRLVNGEIIIRDDLIIDGAGAVDLVISGDSSGNDTLRPGTFITDVQASLNSITGNNLSDNSRVFAVRDDTTVFSNLTVTGGRGLDNDDAGAAISSQGDITLENVTISGNSISGTNGAGGAISSFGTLTISNSEISENFADGLGARGGAINVRGNITIINTSIEGNATSGFAGEGGAVFANGSVTLEDSSITNNSTAGQNARGGGIFSQSSIILINSDLSNNSTSGVNSDGGGILAGGNVDIINSLVSGNSTSSNSSQGGGINQDFSGTVNIIILLGLNCPEFFA